MKTSVWFEKIPPNAEAGVQNGVFLQRRLGLTTHTRTMRTQVGFLLLALLVVQSSEVHANQRCEAQLQAEISRIERDFVRDRPPKSDKVAFDRWANNMHAALNAAGKQAEACERESTPSLTPDRRKTLDNCLARNSAKTDEVLRRYSSLKPTREEQAKQRAELEELHQQRVACDLASRK
ncbi:MAG: hypothetical protein ABL869_10415 [Candidatus Nitrotoga sp.]